MSLDMHLSLPKNGRALEKEIEKAGREGDHKIFYLVCMFKLKSCNLAQAGTEIKYTSGVKFSDSKLAKAIQSSKIIFKKSESCELFLFLFLMCEGKPFFS